MTVSENNLIWIDMEMTGLDPSKERIIEMATIVTDSDLNILAEGPVFAIHQPDSLLQAMDNWNTRQHNFSGLVQRVKASQVTEAEAEKATIEFLETTQKKNSILKNIVQVQPDVSSIAQMDLFNVQADDHLELFKKGYEATQRVFSSSQLAYTF